MNKEKRGVRDEWGLWKCNYVEGCNKPSYYHTTCIEGKRGKHIYICPEHLNKHLGFVKT